MALTNENETYFYSCWKTGKGTLIVNHFASAVGWVIEKSKQTLNLDWCLQCDSYVEEEEVNSLFCELSVLQSIPVQPSYL